MNSKRVDASVEKPKLKSNKASPRPSTFADPEKIGKKPRALSQVPEIVKEGGEIIEGGSVTLTKAERDDTVLEKSNRQQRRAHLNPDVSAVVQRSVKENFYRTAIKIPRGVNQDKAATEWTSKGFTVLRGNAPAGRHPISHAVRDYAVAKAIYTAYEKPRAAGRLLIIDVYGSDRTTNIVEWLNADVPDDERILLVGYGDIITSADLGRRHKDFHTNFDDAAGEVDRLMCDHKDVQPVLLLVDIYHDPTGATDSGLTPATMAHLMSRWTTHLSSHHCSVDAVWLGHRHSGWFGSIEAEGGWKRTKTMFNDSARYTIVNRPDPDADSYEHLDVDALFTTAAWQGLGNDSLMWNLAFSIGDNRPGLTSTDCLYFVNVPTAAVLRPGALKRECVRSYCQFAHTKLPNLNDSMFISQTVQLGGVLRNMLPVSIWHKVWPMIFPELSSPLDLGLVNTIRRWMSGKPVSKYSNRQATDMARQYLETQAWFHSYQRVFPEDYQLNDMVETAVLTVLADTASTRSKLYEGFNLAHGQDVDDLNNHMNSVGSSPPPVSFPWLTMFIGLISMGSFFWLLMRRRKPAFGGLTASFLHLEIGGFDVNKALYRFWYSLQPRANRVRRMISAATKRLTWPSDVAIENTSQRLSPAIVKAWTVDFFTAGTEEMQIGTGWYAESGLGHVRTEAWAKAYRGYTALITQMFNTDTTVVDMQSRVNRIYSYVAPIVGLAAPILEESLRYLITPICGPLITPALFVLGDSAGELQQYFSAGNPVPHFTPVTLVARALVRTGLHGVVLPTIQKTIGVKTAMVVHGLWNLFATNQERVYMQGIITNSTIPSCSANPLWTAFLGTYFINRPDVDTTPQPSNDQRFFIEPLNIDGVVNTGPRVLYPTPFKANPCNLLRVKTSGKPIETEFVDNHPRVHYYMPTNSPGCVPAKTDANLNGVLRKRISVAAPMDPIDQGSSWNYRVIHNTINGAPLINTVLGVGLERAPIIAREEHIDAWIANLSDRMRTMRAVTANEKTNKVAYDHTSRPFLNTEIMVKTDEMLFKRSETGAIDFCPRPLANISPDAQTLIAPVIFEATRRLKTTIGPEAFKATGEPTYVSTIYDRDWDFHITFASSATDAFLTEWASAVANDRGSQRYVVRILVGGDDVLMAITFDGRTWFVEMDASKFDQSQGHLALEAEYTALALLGVGDDVIRKMQKLTRANYRFYGKSFQATVTRTSRGFRDTGGADTTIGNSLMMLLGCVAVFEDIGPATVARGQPEMTLNSFSDLGFNMKMKRGTSISTATFLKGTWWRTSDEPHEYVWSPLISRVLKVGKSINEPTAMFDMKGIPRHLRYNLAADNFLRLQAKAYSAFFQVPVMRAFIERNVGAVMLKPKVMGDDNPAAEWRIQSTTLYKNYKLDVSAAYEQIAHRYSVTPTDIADLELVLLTMPRFSFIGHPLFERMAEVDYN